MNQNYIPYIETVQALSQPMAVRTRVVAAAIAYAAGCHMALPSAPAASAADYYTQNVERNVKVIISRFNEQMLLDCPLAIDYARKFWLYRYEAVHQCPRMNQVPGDFFYSVFGVAEHFSAADVAFLNENAADIHRVYTAVCRLLDEIKPLD